MTFGARAGTPRYDDGYFDPDEFARANGEAELIPAPIGPPLRREGPLRATKPQSHRSIPEATADELLSDPIGLSLPRLPFLGRQNGPFVQGWWHVLAAPPKTGKTELLFALAAEWAALKLKVAFVTEEPRGIWARRVQLHGAPKGLAVIFALGEPQDAILDRALNGEEEIVAFDTWRSLLGVADESDNSQVARALSPIVARGRQSSKTGVLVHHERKGGGRHGEGISGGHAFLGAVDAGIELSRDSSSVNRRHMHTLSRIEPFPALAYELDRDRGGFRLLGEDASVTLAAVKERALEALGEEPLSTSALLAGFAEPRPSKETLRQALLSLSKDGPVTRSRQGQTDLWSRPPSA